MSQIQISVAPMEGVTNFPMRLWLSILAGPQSMTSPFLRVTRSFPQNTLPSLFIPELTVLRQVLPYELIPQYISGDLESFLRATELIPPSVSPIIELNCGCPSPNSLGKIAGSGMLQDPLIFADSIERLTRELGPGRLAIKMRLGLSQDTEFPALLEAIADLPLGRLTIHGRTRADGYKGLARWPLIQMAAQRARCPVFASGDVFSLGSWKDRQAIAPNIQGVMIGRGLLKNPWIFRELKEECSTILSWPVFINALFCYLLLQELSIHNPDRLLTKLIQQRIGQYCGTEFEAWEKLTVELSKLAIGVPMILLKNNIDFLSTISTVAFMRLRFLWTYLRLSLPEAFASSQIFKAKRADEFFERLFAIADEHPTVLLQHQ